MEREAEYIQQQLNRFSFGAPNGSISLNHFNALTHINQVDGYPAPPPSLLPNTFNSVGAPNGSISLNHFNAPTHTNQVDRYPVLPPSLLQNTVNPALIATGALVQTGMLLNYLNTPTHVVVNYTSHHGQLSRS